MIEKYGVLWKPSADAMEIERWCIQKGGLWQDKEGKPCGAGLFTHYRNLQTLLWPDGDHHRWSDMILHSLLEERITILVGARDTGKSSCIARWSLADYWCFPEDTLFIMTSTTARGLKARIWAEVIKLFVSARERYPQLAGNVVETGLYTDEKTRDNRKGMFGIPLIDADSGSYLGSTVKEFAGIKQKRRRLVSDELQHIHVDYLKVLDDLDKGDFKMAGAGNPIGGNGKALDRVSAPKNGWPSLGEVTKTMSWRNAYGGLTINLVGPDSPNFDVPKVKDYPYLINEDDMKSVAARPGGRDSLEWWSKIMGVRKAGVVSNRVLTVDMVEKAGGFKPCIWQMPPTLKILAIDAGFGGDPCVATYAECGVEVGGANVMLFQWQEIVPIVLSTGVTAEIQIAEWTVSKCGELGIAAENVFVECGMRATLGVELANRVGPSISAVLAGGPATKRPVNNELFILDDATQTKRLKTCYEHYSKFVTEMAFSVRELVEGGQARNFPRQAADEFERREWAFVYNDRYELETKDKYKARNNGDSPNYSDSAAIAVEGARRLGFVLERILETPGREKPDETDWLATALSDHKKVALKHELNYA